MKTRLQAAAEGNTWTCKTCNVQFGNPNDKLMECEYCDNHFCAKCLNMTDDEYAHHERSSGMWFCVICKPKVGETIKVEKDIEKRCSEHFMLYSKRIEKIEEKLAKKLERNEIIDIIKRELNSKTNDATERSEKQIIEIVNKQVTEKVKDISESTYSDAVKETVESTVSKLFDTKIDNKIAESEKEIVDRQGRERNIIIFNIDEPNTNLIDDRVQADKETIEKVIKELNFETRNDFEIEQVIRIGYRKTKPGDNPRPVIVTFSTVEAKRSALKNASKLSDSEDNSIKKLKMSNDLTKKDRETEQELLKEKFSKNKEVEGNYRYVIRGPPGDRNLIKIKTQ